MWSPRSMSGKVLDGDTIMSLFEASRGTHSSFNNQPWRFIYAKRNTEYWNNLFNLLVESNKVWLKICFISCRDFKQKLWVQWKTLYNASILYRCCLENLYLDSSSTNLVAHGMQGFDYGEARNDLDIPDTFNVMAMIAIGKTTKRKSIAELTTKRISQ